MTISLELFLTFKDAVKIKDDNGKEEVVIPMDAYAKADSPIQLQVKTPNLPDKPSESLLEKSLALNSVPQAFSGIPHGKGRFMEAEEISLGQTVPTTWVVEADNVDGVATDLLNQDGHLLAEAIDDLIIVCHYSVLIPEQSQ